MTKEASSGKAFLAAWDKSLRTGAVVLVLRYTVIASVRSSLHKSPMHTLYMFVVVVASMTERAVWQPEVSCVLSGVS